MDEADVQKMIDAALLQVATKGVSASDTAKIDAPPKPPIDIDGLFEIFRTSNLKANDILLVKSDNAYVSFDYSAEFKELFERLGFTPIIVTVRANDSFSVVTEDALNKMGYFRKES